ncbi:MAG: hypothetical protein WC465_03855 [Patescibacteria group bacterium]
MPKTLVGFIGQGFIGKNYADDFAERGQNIIRYDTNQYKENKEKIKDCDVVFIAVPTPTTPHGFDDSVLHRVLPLLGKGKVAVIKSTIKLGTTAKFQKLFPDIIVMHSPEFLTEKTAAHDARHPDRNIIGITDINNAELKNKAQSVLSLLPKAPYELISSAEHAELIKYANNCWFYFKVVFMNILYDLEQKHGLDHAIIKNGLMHDPRVGSTHLDVAHQGGRGAGGHCFIKDFEAFIEMLSEQNLVEQKKACETLRNLNLRYLRQTGKNLDLIREVYGE